MTPPIQKADDETAAPRPLVDIKVEGVSTVPRAANGRAFIVVKGASGMPQVILAKDANAPAAESPAAPAAPAVIKPAVPTLEEVAVAAEGLTEVTKSAVAKLRKMYDDVYVSGGIFVDTSNMEKLAKIVTAVLGALESAAPVSKSTEPESTPVKPAEPAPAPAQDPVMVAAVDELKKAVADLAKQVAAPKVSSELDDLKKTVGAIAAASKANGELLDKIVKAAPPSAALSIDRPAAQSPQRALWADDMNAGRSRAQARR